MLQLSAPGGVDNSRSGFCAGICYHYSLLYFASACLTEHIGVYCTDTKSSSIAMHTYMNTAMQIQTRSIVASHKGEKSQNRHQ